jgi:phosphomannomutase/phosphoglucomutase
MKWLISLWLVHVFSLFGEAAAGIFKEYDIRGVVGEEWVEEDAYEIGRAISTYFQKESPLAKNIVIGADGRVHSPLIKDKVMQALCESGFDVIDIGLCTTPAVYFSLYTLPLDAGIMITASHNPGEYNGMKVCLGKKPIMGLSLQRIQNTYAQKNFIPKVEMKGAVSHFPLIEQYVEYLTSQFSHLKGCDFSILIDCGNGAAGSVLPQLIEKMHWKNVKLLYGEIDGTYPHHIADPSVEKYMYDLKRELATSSADFGIAFDGDCDRMAPMTKSGRLIKGDQLVAFFSNPLLKKHPESAVVFDVSSSKFLHDLVRKWGGRPVIVKTGAASVKGKMESEGAFLGGEISCHTIFRDRYFGFDDGIYSMMRLLELLEESGRSLEDWCKDLPQTISSPTYRLPCERSLCFQIMDEIEAVFSKEPEVEWIKEDGLRFHLPNSWAIVRPSNTEPLISFRMEASTEEELVYLKQKFYEVLSKYISCEVLKY